MQLHQSNYTAKKPDSNGIVDYSTAEHQVWNLLFKRQIATIQNRACPEFIEGIATLKLTPDRIPQCNEVSNILHQLTGWTLQPVPALISFDYFFELLSNKQFPVATFIRKKEELDYIKEPDIFHEIFGHCPLLTNAAYADFVHQYGKLGVTATSEERVLLARLFWFTVEFGLVKTPEGLRIYGGGILSSHNETVYSLESDIPTRKPFDVEEALTTDYRIDQIQPIYFVLHQLNDLFHLIDLDLLGLIRKTQRIITNTPAHPC